MIFVRIGLKLRRRIALRIDAERVEEYVAPEMVAEYLTYLRETGSLERAGIAALRVHQVDDESFAFEQVVIKTNCFAVLRGERDVGKVVGPPRCWHCGLDE